MPLPLSLKTKLPCYFDEFYHKFTSLSTSWHIFPTQTKNRQKGVIKILAAFFDTKPYDRLFFEKYASEYGVDLRFYENRLDKTTAQLASGCDAVIVFVNDRLDAETIGVLHGLGIRVAALRSAGYNHVDLRAAFGKITVLRVPAYSPYAVAEHAMGLLLTLNRRLHHAYNRTRDYNFSLNRLMGFDLHGKTAGVIGTGKIGSVFIDICRGFGMNILANDPSPTLQGVEYVSLKALCERSDVISLHCPLNRDTLHIIGKRALKLMKENVYIINTSRGALIDSEALLNALLEKRIGGAGLDVYEEEAGIFYEDLSNTIIPDETLMRLLAMPNVIVTSHQGFFTREALDNIAKATLGNLKRFSEGGENPNEIRASEA